MGLIILALVFILVCRDRDYLFLLGIPLAAVLFYLSKRDVKPFTDLGLVPKTILLSISNGFPTTFTKTTDDYVIIVSRRTEPVLGPSFYISEKQAGIWIIIMSDKIINIDNTKLISLKDISTDIDSVSGYLDIKYDITSSVAIKATLDDIDQMLRV